MRSNRSLEVAEESLFDAGRGIAVEDFLEFGRVGVGAIETDQVQDRGPAWRGKANLSDGHRETWAKDTAGSRSISVLYKK